VTRPPLLSRRALLTGLWLAGSSALAWGQTRKGNDQGLGGTGISGGQDQGMGGTGIVGVIQRFGSIFVNGERVSYAPDVPVRIDGETTAAKALKIGQLARVLAQRDANGALTTGRIDVVSEVTGPIEAVRPGEITVLGQTVVSPGRESWRKVGTHVAVFGLRRSDGVIVASLVDPRGNTPSRISGVVVRDRNGLSIGGLRLTGADPALVGRRVQAEGRVAQGVMQVARIRPDDLRDFARASRLLVEGYVHRVGNELQFGSGYIARDNSRFQPSGETRVVVDAVPDGAGGLRAESVQAVTRFPGESVSGPQAPPRSQGPMQGTGGPHGPGGPNSPGAPGDPGAPGSPGAPGFGRGGGLNPPAGMNPPGGFGSGGESSPPGFGGSPAGPPSGGGGGFGGSFGGGGGGAGGGGGGRR